MRGHRESRAAVVHLAQVAFAVACVVFICAGAASAGAPNYRFAVNAHDAAVAKRIATIKGDLPPLGWKGGATKPDRTPDSTTCAGQPRDDLRGLTVTGDAATTYQLPGTLLAVQVQLLANSAMTEADWQRNHPRSGMLACFAKEFAKDLHQPGAHVVRTKLLPMPQLGDHQWAAQVVVTSPGAAHPALFDIILVSSGRTQYSLLTAAPDTGNADEVATLEVEIRVALGLEARTRDLVASAERGAAPRIEGTFSTVDREVAVVHTTGLGMTWTQPWRFVPGCANGGCTTTMSHPSNDHPGTMFRATLRPAGVNTYRGHWTSHSDCTITYADGHTSVLANGWLDQVFTTLHLTVGPDGKATGFTGTRLVRSTPLAAARTHGCKITSYQLDELRTD